jgi:hypothetical protein
MGRAGLVGRGAPLVVDQPFTGLGFEKHLVRFLGPMKIRDIRLSEVNAYVEARTGEVAAGTIKEVNV